MSAQHQYPWLINYPKNVNWFEQLEAERLDSLLDEAAKESPTREFIDFLDKTYTYEEIADQVNKVTRSLQDLGVQKGTRVGIFLPNCPYFIIYYFAILKAGGIVVNFNPLYVIRELKHQVQDSEIEILVTLDLKQLFNKAEEILGVGKLNQLIVCSMADILPKTKSILFRIFKFYEIASVGEDKRIIKHETLTQNNGMFQFIKIDPHEDVAVLQYTGGTTGVPKGAMLTHANLYINTEQAFLWLEGAEPDQEIMLGVLPLFHVFAMTAVMNFSIRIKAKVILLPRFELKQVMSVINEKKPTIFPAVPTIYTAINRLYDNHKHDLSSIKICLSGGAPLPVEVRDEFERITGCSLVEGYGLSETSPVACVEPLTGTKKPGSIGFPVPGTIVEFISLEDGRTVMPTGKKGELCIRGPQVMKGYWNKREETEKAMQGGHFHTGDVGYIDEDGYIFIVDRIKDLIIAGGYNIYPRQVEEAIYLHPAIQECIVAGIPDQYRGQTVKAYIVLKEGQEITEHDLKKFLKDKLSPLEIPKLYEFRDTLPKTMIGKLSRKDVLEEEAKKEASE